MYPKEESIVELNEKSLSWIELWAVKSEDDGEDDNDRKRKRSDSDLEDEAEQIKAVKDEPEAGDVDGEEEDLLENALDTLQDSEGGERKTREDAEADRKKLLSGELLVEGAAITAGDDEDLDFTGDGEEGRRSFVVNNAKLRSRQTEEEAKLYKDIRALPIKEEEAELLRKAGYTVVSDAEVEATIVGGNMPTPFRSKVVKDENGEEISANTHAKKLKGSIQFRTKFDMVELDANGLIVDKGDNDFTPSKSWKGRMAGFEFKLGERGLGYYRTGKKVVVPSNTAY